MGLLPAFLEARDYFYKAIEAYIEEPGNIRDLEYYRSRFFKAHCAFIEAYQNISHDKMNNEAEDMLTMLAGYYKKLSNLGLLG